MADRSPGDEPIWAHQRRTRAFDAVGLAERARLLSVDDVRHNVDPDVDAGCNGALLPRGSVGSDHQHELADVQVERRQSRTVSRQHDVRCASAGQAAMVPESPCGDLLWRTFWRVTLPSIRWGLAYEILSNYSL